MTAEHIRWDRGVAEVQMLGGMLGPVRFRLADGREVQPFAVAPWSDDSGSEHDALPGILKRLRGEWPCVPFGAPEVPQGLPDHWQPAAANAIGSDFHGFSAHNDWHIVERGEGTLTIGCDYPADHPIRGLRRRIEGVPGETRLKITLTIEARQAAATTLALHPVFRLPSKVESARIDPGPFAQGRVFPMALEPGVSVLTPDSTFSALDAVPAADEDIALSKLPLGIDTEELVQLVGASGHARLTVAPEGYVATLDYDPEVFPSLLLWISNRGRTAYPWNGRFLAVGIEPVRGAFDLGPDVGCDPSNPIAAAGTPTALSLSPGEIFQTTYVLGVDATDIIG